MQPIDYIRDVQNPLDRAFKGYQQGMAVRNDRQAQQDALIKKEAYKKMQSDLGVLANNPNPTSQDYIKMMVQYPQLSENLKRSFDVMDTTTKDNNVKAVSQMLAASRSGNHDMVKDMLKQRMEAAKNSGNAEEADSTEAVLKMYESNPIAGESTLGIILSSAVGAEDFASTYDKMSSIKREDELQEGKIKQQGADLNKTNADTKKVGADTVASIDSNNRENQKQPYEIAKAQADINKTITDTSISKSVEDRANLEHPLTMEKMRSDISKTNVDIEKVVQETIEKKAEIVANRNPQVELTKDGEKLLNESIQNSINSKNLSKQYEGIADEIDEVIKTAGVTGKAEEYIKKVWGSEDKVTRLRQDYRRLRNTQVLNMLPPGVASDKDVKIAMGAFPEDTTNPEVISGFMRGMAKLQRYDAAISSAKGAWITNVGNLGASRNGVNIQGVSVPAGTTFEKYAKAQGELEKMLIKADEEGLNIDDSLKQDFLNESLQKKKVTLSNHIKDIEKYSQKPYWDHKQYTNGYGTKAKHKNEVISKDEAEKRLAKRLDKDISKVKAFVPKGTPKGIQDALTSLSYNAGTKWMKSGLGNAVKSKDWRRAKQLFLKYNKASGKTSQGLVKRRKIESEWFNV